MPRRNWQTGKETKAWNLMYTQYPIIRNGHTVRPWDARFLGNEKTSAAQKRVT